MQFAETPLPPRLWLTGLCTSIRRQSRLRPESKFKFDPNPNPIHRLDAIQSPRAKARYPPPQGRWGFVFVWGSVKTFALVHVLIKGCALRSAFVNGASDASSVGHGPGVTAFFVNKMFHPGFIAT